MKKIISSLLVIFIMAGLFAVTVSAEEDPFSVLTGLTLTKDDCALTYENGELVFTNGNNEVRFDPSELTEKTEMNSDCMSYFNEDYSKGIYLFSDESGAVAVKAYGYDLFDSENWDYDFEGNYVLADVEPNGSEFYPWEYDGLKVFVGYGDGYLCFTGDGEIPDRDDGTVFPWDAVRDEITEISFNEGITRIGKNAFRGYGENGFCLGFYSESLTEIADGAFEGTGLCDTLFVPECLDSIGSRAFADTKIEEIQFSDKPASIAADAFDGVNATAFVPFGEWNEGDMNMLGGGLTFKYNYSFHVDYIVDGENMGWVEYDVPAGEELNEPIDEQFYEGFHFVRKELVSGTYPDFDENGTTISVAPVDNILINAYFEENAEEAEGSEDSSAPGNIDATEVEEVLEDILESDEIKSAAKKLAAAAIGLFVGVIALVAAVIVVIILLVKNAKKKKADDK